MSTSERDNGEGDIVRSKEFWVRGQALGFPIDFDKVMQHLKQDMRDDWYFDCLQYEDLFGAKEVVKECIAALLLEWNGLYTGDRSVIRNVPKKGYGERYALETDFFDRFIYQAICSFLIPFYDQVLRHRVLSYRYDSSPLSGKYLFKNKIQRWFTFEGVTLTFVGANQHLLVTDVSNFFENVSRSQLISELEKAVPFLTATGPEKLQIRNAIFTLDRLLGRWTFSGSHGLPQNRDASSFLSNILLASVDKEMASKGHDYYRYVDDIRILANSEMEARRALQDLIRQLRNVGMNINANKTRILAPNSSSDEISEFFPSQDNITASINNMWKSRSRRVIIRSIPYIISILSECIACGDSQSRRFRFAVNRVARIVESEFFGISDELALGLLDTLSGTLASHAVSTDQYCRIFAILDRSGSYLTHLEAFLLDESSSIHDWQNYNIWLYLAEKKFKSDALLRAAEKKVSEDLYSGEAAAILIWLRCVSETSLIEKCVSDFPDNLPFQNVRYLLIAASILGEEAQVSMRGKIITKLRGTSKRVISHQNGDGLPFASRERPDILDLINEVDDYER